MSSNRDDLTPEPSRFAVLRRILLGQRSTILASIVIAIFVAIAILAPTIAPYDPLAQSYLRINAYPSGEHWLGTDQFGRDVLSRLIYGSRNSLIFGLISPTLAAIFGTALGVAADTLAGSSTGRRPDHRPAARVPGAAAGHHDRGRAGRRILEHRRGDHRRFRSGLCPRGTRLNAGCQAGALCGGRDCRRRHDADDHPPPCCAQHRGPHRRADDALGRLGHSARSFSQFPRDRHPATQSQLGQHHPRWPGQHLWLSLADRRRRLCHHSGGSRLQSHWRRSRDVLDPDTAQ